MIAGQGIPREHRQRALHFSLLLENKTDREKDGAWLH